MRGRGSLSGNIIVAAVHLVPHNDKEAVDLISVSTSRAGTDADGGSCWTTNGN